MSQNTPHPTDDGTVTPGTTTGDAAHATPSTTGGRSIRRSQDAPAKLSEVADPSVTPELQAVLDGHWADAKQAVRASLAEGDVRADPTLDLEASRQRTLDQVRALAESGMPRGAFSVEHGGSGDTGATLTSIELLGHADLSLMVKAGVQWGLWGGAVENLGTERHVPLIKDIIDLRVLGCFGMTERGHGSDVQSLETTATYDPETQEFIVNSPTPSSEKWFIGNAARDARMAAVFCQLHTPGEEESHGVHCLVVPIRDENGTPLPGVRIGDHGYKGGLKGVDNGTLAFDHVRVPRENLLNKFADVSEDGTYSSPIENPNRRFFTMLGALIRGRITVGAAAGASARTALDIAVRYADLRRQFSAGDGLPEKRLIDHRNHRLRLLPRVARAYGLQLATNKLIARVHELEHRITDRTAMSEEDQWDQRELEAHAAALKAANTAHATDTIQECREACGGAGYMTENFLTTLKADSDVFTTFEGDNAVMIQLAAKELLTGFAREVGGLNPLEMVRFGLDSFGTLLKRRTAAETLIQNLVDSVTNQEETSLFDPAYQIELLSNREDSLLRSLVRRLRPAQKMETEEAAQVVDRAQDHLIACGWAHVDRIILEAFLEAESELESETARQVLEQVRDTYFLSLITEHAGWYQEQNLLTGTRTKAARAALNDLVDSLAPWSTVLVDAFAVPSTLTSVPLLTDYADMEWYADTHPAHPAEG
ncbi:acyl-CoA dehydrogenase family protein [Corynebacterium bovis]|uniref:acyl-CoA dehydrogenase family protein n=1 Tax=Corynebacterium bovis TaxID=36808 RepID=UPI0031399711